jgi:tRNA(Ile)-lysidine synthase
MLPGNIPPLLAAMYKSARTMNTIGVAGSRTCRITRPAPRRPYDDGMTQAETRHHETAGGDDGLLSLNVRRHPLVSEIARRLQGECNVPAGAKLMVAVSGGADSCALLLACTAIAARHAKGKPALEIEATHVHHHLRAAADEEAEFVGSLCAELGVDVHVEHIQPATARGSTAASARRLRYEALQRVADKVGAPFVVTAHHAEDQLETMLMAMGRGAGLRGLRGMRWARTLGGNTALVRPMLLARKRDCESLCSLAGVEWREDPSNIDPRSRRARIRRDVLPIMEELWPGTARRSVGIAELVDAAQQVLTTQVEAAFGPSTAPEWPRAALAQLPRAVISEGLRRAAEHLHGGVINALGQRQLRAVACVIASRELRPKRFEWPGGIVVSVTSKTVSLRRA